MNHYLIITMNYSIYLTSNKTTRNKSIEIPKRLKTINNKNSFIRALMIFKCLHTVLLVYTVKTETKELGKRKHLKIITT